MGLNRAYRHTTSVQRDDLVVEPGPTGLMLGDELRLEAAVTVSGNLDGQFTELALERLLALAVAGIVGNVGHRSVTVVAQVLGQFGLQSLLDE